ncbi:VWA domain-containing protein [Jannaschia sp. R86511]|uniref:VWA domain-containing protein n=1 Tax=Jannaschia sp. R86511 TaxID=3093853 RepID=UPI0036D34327
MPAAQDPPGPTPPTPSPQPAPPRVAPGASGGWGRRLARRHRRLTVLSVVVVTLLVLAAGAVVVGLLAEREEPTAACTGGPTVRVVVDPTLAPSLQRVVDEAEGDLLVTGVCARVELTARASSQAAADLAAAGEDAAGVHLWLPDSSLWLGRAAPGGGPTAATPASPAPSAATSPAPAAEASGEASVEASTAQAPETSTGPSTAASTPSSTPTGPFALTALGSLVTTPVVLAASPEVATRAGWTEAPPSWAVAMAAPQGLALPELSGSAAGLQALVALRSSLADPDEARGALTAAALAVERGRVEDGAAALGLVVEGGGEAPLAPTTEQQVFVGNRGAATTSVVAVQPADGLTSLDYPLVRLDTAESEAGVDAAAIEGVVRLLEGAGRDAAVVDGFRRPVEAAAPAGSPTGAPTGTPAVVPVPTVADVDGLLARLSELSRPSRVLAVIDASASMRAVTDSGATRAQIAQDAATESLALFPDSAAIGLWFFAVGMGEGGDDFVEVVPVAPLDPDAGEQREALADGVSTLPDRLTPGGTGLYDTTLAAVRALREDFDPGASNSVVLVTDGREEDPSGISRQELLDTLAAEADPDRPVRVVAIGISDDVDAEELTAVAEATGGAAYLAERPEDFRMVLFDALRRR